MTTDLYLPAAEDPPDAECRETVEGGHALILGNIRDPSLVIEYGDCSFGMRCQCGHTVARDLRPDRSGDPPVAEWMAHVRGGVRGMLPHCQCGERLGDRITAPVTSALLDRIALAWEKHSMSLSAVRRG